LARPSTRSSQCFIKIVPVRIVEEYESDLPSPWIMLQVLFPLTCITNVLLMPEVDEALEPIPFREAVDNAFAVFPDAPDQIIRNAHI
jgi:hypothetical protein